MAREHNYIFRLLPVLLSSVLGVVSFADDKTGAAYIDNGTIRLGCDLTSGGSVFYFAESASRRNLLNHFDRGRFVQQSYYGETDGSMWGKKPWVWNPVQGGDYKGNPAKVLEQRSTPVSVYVKSMPKHWANGDDIIDAVMEQWITLSNHVACIRYRFAYTGSLKGKPRHQEMPAVFVDYALPNLLFYKGVKPWTNDTLTSIVPGWPNEYYKRVEPWSAFVDDKRWGVGVFTPGTPDITAYRYKGAPGPEGSGCSYFAPVRTLAVAGPVEIVYDVYLTIGDVDDIRKRFYEIHKGGK
jgi:hypothetical protein